jgi:16S rRNA (guanine527-N7)-methyltransferase
VLDRKEALAKLDVSRETIERLDLYANLIRKWQKTINLVSPSTLPVLWTRHILDSAQLARLGSDHEGWVDIGSGAGFPGLVVAILSLERTRSVTMHLIESDKRKAGFLREAARITAAPVIVHATRAEEIIPTLVGKVTAVTARGFASLPKLLDLAEPLLTTGATGIFPKGQTLNSELEEASQRFAFDLELLPSRTDHAARIAVITELRRRAIPQRGNIAGE